VTESPDASRGLPIIVSSANSGATRNTDPPELMGGVGPLGMAGELGDVSGTALAVMTSQYRPTTCRTCTRKAGVNTATRAVGRKAGSSTPTNQRRGQRTAVPIFPGPPSARRCPALGERSRCTAAGARACQHRRVGPSWCHTRTGCRGAGQGPQAVRWEADLRVRVGQRQVHPCSLCEGAD
jgi:hypothetical protein